MPDYIDIPLKTFVDLAKESSSEMGAMDNGLMVDYETGRYFQVPDAQTALFIASAREIVLELARRIQVLERNTS